MALNLPSLRTECELPQMDSPGLLPGHTPPPLSWAEAKAACLPRHTTLISVPSLMCPSPWPDTSPLTHPEDLALFFKATLSCCHLCLAWSRTPRHKKTLTASPSVALSLQASRTRAFAHSLLPPLRAHSHDLGAPQVSPPTTVSVLEDSTWRIHG